MKESSLLHLMDQGAQAADPVMDSEDSVSATTVGESVAEVSSTDEQQHGCENDAASEGLSEESTQVRSTSEVSDADVNLVAEEDETLVAHQNAALLDTVQHMQACFQESSALPVVCTFMWAPVQAQACDYSSMWAPAELAPGQWNASDQSDAQYQETQACAWEPSENARTTVMLRNLPNNYTRNMLADLFACEGFGSAYNFLYLPIDFKTQSALGYAFINFSHPAAALQFWNVFDGYSNWAVPTRKASIVRWCEPNQGLELHIERYRNSPVMHDSVPDNFKPVLLENGIRMPFPPPTKAIRAPRARDCRRDYR